MSQSLAWKYFTPRHIDELQQCSSREDCQKVLSEIVLSTVLPFTTASKQDHKKEDKVDLVVQLHFHTLVFCQEHHFSPEQISTVLGICHVIYCADWQNDNNINPKQQTSCLSDSIERFQRHVLLHGVDRSPDSIQIFTRVEIQALIDFIYHHYYRHHDVYQYIFRGLKELTLEQTSVNGIVGVTRRARPALNQAILFSTTNSVDNN